MYSESQYDFKYGVQVIFTSIPNKDGKKFIHSMDKDYFEKYKDEIKDFSNEMNLYL